MNNGRIQNIYYSSFTVICSVFIVFIIIQRFLSISIKIAIENTATTLYCWKSNKKRICKLTWLEYARISIFMSMFSYELNTQMKRKTNYVHMLHMFSLKTCTINLLSDMKFKSASAFVDQLFDEIGEDCIRYNKLFDNNNSIASKEFEDYCTRFIKLENEYLITCKLLMRFDTFGLIESA